MFTQIRTSSKNKEIVADLTHKFNLGAENIIARIEYLSKKCAARIRKKLPKNSEV